MIFTLELRSISIRSKITFLFRNSFKSERVAGRDGEVVRVSFKRRTGSGPIRPYSSRGGGVGSKSLPPTWQNWTGSSEFHYSFHSRLKESAKLSLSRWLRSPRIQHKSLFRKIMWPLKCGIFPFYLDAPENLDNPNLIL